MVFKKHKGLGYFEITFGCGNIFLDCNPVPRSNYVCFRFIKVI